MLDALAKGGIAAGVSAVSGSHPVSIAINAGCAFGRALLGTNTAAALPISATEGNPLGTG